MLRDKGSKYVVGNAQDNAVARGFESWWPILRRFLRVDWPILRREADGRQSAGCEEQNQEGMG
ncbi:MAG: hypothetical protein AB7O38_28530 [Pirellulaceae bacterium]